MAAIWRPVLKSFVIQIDPCPHIFLNRVLILSISCADVLGYRDINKLKLIARQDGSNKNTIHIHDGLPYSFLSIKFLHKALLVRVYSKRRLPNEPDGRTEPELTQLRSELVSHRVMNISPNVLPSITFNS